MKKTILDDIKNRTENVLDMHKKKLIYSIVNTNNWYLDISLNTFLSILLDLNYTKEEAIDIYKELCTME